MGTIPEFYSGQQIFITGGSGFMGKVLIEKLLRSCPDLDVIFVLLRSKKGKSIEERFADIIKQPLFDVLREKNPLVLNKLIPIDGDVTELELGISSDNFKLMEKVSVIFHAAASVRFDDPLRDAILINTRGTREVMRFAETLVNLKVIVHVSTTYCNPDRYVIEEKLYPPYTDWKEAIKIAEYFDTETLNIFNDKLSSFQPNTYTFTKSMAEHIVNDYKDRIPVVIYRPSIVISSIAEPISGWIDNFNGPVGMLVASGSGILRTMYANPNVVSDFTPVDLAIKGMIIASYQKGIQNKKSENDELSVFNCSTSSIRGITTAGIIELARELIKEKPFVQMLWVPGGAITSSRTLNYFRFMFFQVLVACGIDGLAKIFNRKPFLLKLQRKIYAANLALHYFVMNQWKFINTNFVALDDNLPLHDVRAFAFLHLKNLDIKEFFYNALIGARIYLLKESDDNLEYAKKKYWRIYYLDKILRFLFMGFIIYVILVKFKGLSVARSYFNEI